MLEKNIYPNTSSKITWFSFNKVDPNIFYLCVFFVAIGSLILKVDEFNYFLGKFIWAEDGTVFLSKAQSLGLRAIIEPYAGYLHLYPRLVAQLSVFFDLLYRPLVILSGWLLAYLFMVFMFSKIAKRVGFSSVSVIFLIILVTCQPHYGENFFNLTNSQWMLGTALSLWTLTPGEDMRRRPFLKALLLILLSLTGPFSIILIPLLLLKLVVLKDWNINKLMYCIVFLGAVIQALFLSLSFREASIGTISVSPWDWFLSFFQILMFGANTINLLLLSIVFWTVLASSFVYKLIKKQDINKNLFMPTLLLAAALIFILAAQYSHKHNPLAVVALGGGNRYSWIPYALIFFVALWSTSSLRFVKILITLLMVAICIDNFHKVSSPNLQFESFAKFSKQHEVVIPIPPQMQAFPGWHIHGSPKKNDSPITGQILELGEEQFSFNELSSTPSKGELLLQANGNDPYLYFNHPINCPGSTDIGIEIHILRKTEGWIQLFWSESNSFVETNSLKRWYPENEIRAQFAFPSNGDSTFIRIDPINHSGSINIKEIKFFCLR